LLQSSRAFLVAISSNTATSPAPGRIAYGCSKAASYALFSGLAEELAESTVSVIQLMPDRQVVTRGLRRRRPPGFDFSAYIQPEVFKEPVLAILRSRGAGMNGQCRMLS
jgi:short-subunit dehydrogenase